MNEYTLTRTKLSKFFTSDALNFIFIFFIFTTIIFCMPAYADALDAAKSLLSKGAQIGGGLWAVWGLVQLGISIKDHSGPGISSAIWQIIGGGIIMAAGTYISSMDLTFTV